MDYVIVNRIRFNNIVSGLEDANDRLHLLWLLVAVLISILEWISVQDGWKGDVQDLVKKDENILKF